MDLENGPSIGSIISNKAYFDQSGNEIKIKKETIILFTSIYCFRCIQILPFLGKIASSSKANFVLFSNGNSQDHEEMISSFKWNFSVIALADEQMEIDFLVREHPFFIIVDEHNTVFKKGIVNDSNQLKRIINKNEKFPLMRFFT